MKKITIPTCLKCPLDDDAEDAKDGASISELEIQPWPEAEHAGTNLEKPVTGVLIHHKPTGIMVTANRYKHPDLNREEALRELGALLSKLNREKDHASD